MSQQGRYLIVSNRLPVTLKVDESGKVRLTNSSGGLATGLAGWFQNSHALWIGWDGIGDDMAPGFRDAADAEMEGKRLVPVKLTAAEVEAYYADFSNGVLWPLFHYLLDRVPVAEHDWEAYQAVNEKFASVVASYYRPGDSIWVHDYHLMLTPGMLRRRFPEARIGFFLHVPFPSSEVFRILPWRTEILEGLLGSNLIGFHTYAYVRHFAMAVLHILGIEPDVDRVSSDGREVRLKALPIGIDTASLAKLAADPKVQEESRAIRGDCGGRRIILSVDRLDYTKGLPRRLLAIEKLLSTPGWADRVRFIQIAVPTRDRTPAYQRFKREVEQLVSRINGTSGTIGSLPIHYLNRSVPLRRLVALYLAADVLLVTPLRDGLNLVAKEFVASRIDNDGVLVLSEFAGAATELGETLLVNPYDLIGLTETLMAAIDMPREERAARMRLLRSRILANTSTRWAEEFLSALRAPPGSPSREAVLPAPRALWTELPALASAKALAVVLDYDGTLVQIQPSPDIAFPDESLLGLLRRLCRTPGVRVHLLSGRPRDALERWFAGMPLTLWAEHGFWRKDCNTGAWLAASALPENWQEKILPILEHFTKATPGSFSETKSASVTWHYRLADPQFGARQAHELRMLLGDALSNQPLEVREGKKVLEIRLRGVHKGLAIERLLTSPAPPDAILAIGDDATDEDMFVAVARVNGVGIHVGRGPSQAPYTLPDPGATRQFLEHLIAGRAAPSR